MCPHLRAPDRLAEGAGPVIKKIKKPADKYLPVLLFGFEFRCSEPQPGKKAQTRKSDSALDFAAPQATGANGHALGRAVDDNANVLDIGSPNTPRLVVSMADVVAGHDALIAHLTELAHTLHLLRSKLISKQKIL